MLETYIETKQIDLILDFDTSIPHMPDWDPPAIIDNFITAYNKEHKFPIGIFLVNVIKKRI